MKRIISSLMALLVIMTAGAQTLSKGGQFMDLLLPMEGSEAATAGDWGTTAGSAQDGDHVGEWAGTLGRWKDNGIEDATRSYWGGNIIKGSDGKYHIYVAGWPESTSNGHAAWGSASRVYHVVSDNVWGPYSFVSDIGTGHNPEVYKTGDTYVIYKIQPLGYYKSNTLGDSWTSGEYTFDLRDRILIAGENRETSLSNCSFAKREDGSFVMIDRGGGIWVSRDGLTDPWHQLTDASVYLNSEITNRGSLEDPVIWRDHLQYHMVVNDWRARYAYYYRSKDGLHWVKEAGKAYTGQDPFAKHSDETVEAWYKYERPRVFQDDLGRAVRMNFAVIDCVKSQDKGSDGHSSKNINMPLTRQLLLEVQTISSTSATVLVKAEEGFNPAADLDFQSLKFGSHDKVNYGNGFTYSSHITSGDDVVITFTGSDGDSGIAADEWAPKMLGQETDGCIAFGYAKMPDVDYQPAMLSALTPAIAADGTVQTVTVANYGQTAAAATTVRVYNQAGTTLLAHGTTSALAAYGSETVTLTKDATAAAGYKSIQIRFYNGETLLNTENIPLTAITAAQTDLQAAISEAQTLYDDDKLTEGKAALNTAITNASAVVNCYNVAAIEEQKAALTTALNTYKYTNASPTNGLSITIPNATMDDLSEWTLTRLDATDAPGWKTSSKGGDYSGFDGNFMETWVNQSGALAVANRASQTLPDMPAGRYRLRARVIACRQNNASANTGVTLFANSETTSCKTANNTPEEFMVEIRLDAAGPLTIGIDIPSTTEANWVAWDNVTLKYFGTAEGEIVEEEPEPLTFDNAKTYYIKWNTTTYQKVYWRSPKYNTASDASLHRTASQSEAARFLIVNDANNEGLFYLYDVVSHTFVVPAANASNGTAWTTSPTLPAKTAITEKDGYYSISSTAGGEANAYANDNNDGDVKNYSGGSQWLIEEAAATDATMGVNPQAVYRLKHYNGNRNRYMAAEPGDASVLLTTNNDADKGNFSLLPVSGRTGYFYIYNTSGYFVTPAAGKWTLSKSTPAQVKVEANVAYMEAKSGGANVTYLLGEPSQYANPQNDGGVEMVKNYANRTDDNGNNWMLEPVSEQTALLNLTSVTSGIESLVASCAAAETLLCYEATVGDAGYGTLVVPFDADVEGDVEAWELETINGTNIIGTKRTDIAANRPVLLRNKGSLSLTAKSGTVAYSASGSGVGFYRVADGYLPAMAPFRAYLQTPMGSASMLTLSFDDVVTGISAPMTVGHTHEVYTLDGQRRQQAGRGMNILRMKDGSVRKVVNK